MTIETVRRSDVSGELFSANTGARVRIMFNDPAKDDLRADLTTEEVERLLPWAKPVQTRPDRRRRR